jgi:hypothetical protein
MPAVNLIEQHGTLTNGTLLDEPNVLVTSLTITPSRTKKEYKGEAGSVKALRFSNPQIGFAFQGTVQAVAGLADQHVGTSVASLANFAASKFGFDPDDGVNVYEDPSATENGEDPTQITFTSQNYPFVA